MSQVILLSTYNGGSDYVCEVTCTGVELDWATVVARGLSDERAWERYQASSWIHNWFEVNPGDQITVLTYNGDYPDRSHHRRFTIPPTGLIDPPQSLDDHRNGQWLEAYLESQCPFEELPHPFATDE